MMLVTRAALAPRGASAARAAGKYNGPCNRRRSGTVKL
jgi:hypothetical protein